MILKLKLEEFNYTIVYKKEKEHCNSEELSRMYTPTTKDVGAEKENERLETLCIGNEDAGKTENPRKLRRSSRRLLIGRS
jgi:hypothetical protein